VFLGTEVATKRHDAEFRVARNPKLCARDQHFKPGPPSLFTMIRLFHMIKAFTIDTMHIVYLGVIKRLMKYWCGLLPKTKEAAALQANVAASTSSTQVAASTSSTQVDDDASTQFVSATAPLQIDSEDDDELPAEELIDADDEDDEECEHTSQRQPTRAKKGQAKIPVDALPRIKRVDTLTMASYKGIGADFHTVRHVFIIRYTTYYRITTICSEFVAIYSEFVSIYSEFVSIYSEFVAIYSEFVSIYSEFVSIDSDIVTIY
jgi:hypothetical protein